VPEGASPAAARRPGPIDRRLIKQLPGLKVSVAASVTVGLLATAGVVVQAVALAHLLAGAMPGARPGDRARWLALFGLGVCARAVVASLGEILAAASASRAVAALRSRLVAAALRRAPTGGPGDDGRGRGWGPRLPEEPGAGLPGGPGDIATLAGRGLDALDVYVGRCLPDLVLAVAAPLALLLAVGVLDWLSAVIMVVVVALFPVFGALVGRTSMSLASQRWRQVEQLGRQIADIFDGLPALRAFGRAGDERARMVRANEALGRSSTRVLRVAFLSALVLDTLGSVSVALVAVPLGLRLLSGGAHLPAALAVLIVAPEVFLPLRRASAEFHESTEGLAAAARALAVVGPAPAGRREPRGGPWRGGEPSGTGGAGPGRSRTGAEAGPPDPRRAVVELRAVTVELPGRELPLLADASLAISPGETVVLVGPSGAGKSTVISLLLGFASPASGDVAVGGEDLRLFEPAQWRRLLTYLPEHPTLLAAGLADNLRLANPAATEAELLWALGQAGAPELVAGLGDGWATRLGDGGRPVSAGELQRIALARVFLRPRSLYLLDEPTVHLDQVAEAHVLKGLRQALDDRSALIVSHRPAVLAIADRAVTLRAGRLVDVTPDLLAAVPA
jgi:thiol reductant ABC exporter CydD subunit